MCLSRGSYGVYVAITGPTWLLLLEDTSVLNPVTARGVGSSAGYKTLEGQAIAKLL